MVLRPACKIYVTLTSAELCPERFVMLLLPLICTPPDAGFPEKNWMIKVVYAPLNPAFVIFAKIVMFAPSISGEVYVKISDTLSEMSGAVMLSVKFVGANAP